MYTLLKLFSWSTMPSFSLPTLPSSINLIRKCYNFPWTMQANYERLGLLRTHLLGPYKRHKRRNPLGDKPLMKGIVIKTLIKKPKKPNSANRKCVLARLSNGSEKVCFVPGVGHPLTEHSVVLVKLKRVKDVPGLRLRVIRGKYDCPLPIKNTAGSMPVRIVKTEVWAQSKLLTLFDNLFVINGKDGSKG